MAKLGGTCRFVSFLAHPVSCRLAGRATLAPDYLAAVALAAGVDRHCDCQTDSQPLSQLPCRSRIQAASLVVLPEESNIVFVMILAVGECMAVADRRL